MNFGINNYKDKFFKFSNNKAMELYKSLNIDLFKEYEKIFNEEDKKELNKEDFDKVYSVLAYYLYMIIYDEINNIKTRYQNFKLKNIEFDNGMNSIILTLYESSNRKYTVSNIQKNLIDKIKEHKLEEKIQEIIKEDKSLDTTKEVKKPNIKKQNKPVKNKKTSKRRIKSAFYGVDNNKDNNNTFENVDMYYLKAVTNITVNIILNANFKSILVKDINISNLLLKSIIKILL